MSIYDQFEDIFILDTFSIIADLNNDYLPFEAGKDPVDLFTLFHFLWGMSFRLLDFSVENTLIIAILWEILENKVLFTKQESRENIIIDIMAVMLGWLVVEYTYQKGWIK